MAALTDAELLTTFDRQIRRRPGRETGFEVELVTDPAPMLRMTPTAKDASWAAASSGATSTKTNADAAIADAVEHFRPFGREFEWKHYGYDEPRDLTDRLTAAGFTPDEEEALVVGEVSVVRERLASAPQPDGIAIRLLRTDADGAAADWQGINDLHVAVWGDDGTDMNTAIAASIAADPEATSMWLAVAEDGTVVSAARTNFHRAPTSRRCGEAARSRRTAAEGSTRRWWRAARTRPPSAATGSCRSTRRPTAGPSSSASGCAP